MQSKKAKKADEAGQPLLGGSADDDDEVANVNIRSACCTFKPVEELFQEGVQRSEARMLVFVMLRSEAEIPLQRACM